MVRFMVCLPLLLLLIAGCPDSEERGGRASTLIPEPPDQDDPSAFANLTPEDILALKQAGDARTFARVLASPQTPESIRRLAAFVVQELGPGGKECVPALRKLLEAEDPRLRVTSAFSLWRIEGETRDTVPVLVEGATASDPQVSQMASWDLGRMGDAAREAAGALRKLVADESADAKTRTWAADALWRVSGDPAEVVPTFIDFLSDPDARQWAASSLGSIGLPHAAGAMEKLRAVLAEEESPEIRASIARALACLEETELALRTLMSVIGDEGASLQARRFAIMHLELLGADAEPALPLLDQLGKTGPDMLSTLAQHLALLIRYKLER